MLDRPPPRSRVPGVVAAAAGVWQAHGRAAPAAPGRLRAGARAVGGTATGPAARGAGAGACRQVLSRARR